MGMATALIIVALAATPMTRHAIRQKAVAAGQKVVAIAQDHGDAATRPAQGRDPNIVEPIEIGMNTGGASYYTSEEAFADPIRSHGQPMLDSGPDGLKQEQLKHDGDGNLIDVPAGAKFTVRLHDGNAPLIYGTYHCQISPGWRVEGFIGSVVSQSGTKFTVMMPKTVDHTTFAVSLYAEKNGAALTTLSCRYPGDASDALFRKDFLDDMRPFRIIRFMDWMTTNNEPPRTWATRPTAKSIDQISSGVALEYMVALANELHADPWFTLPLDVDPDYYRNFAVYVRDHLDPGLKAYVELSNEVWNESFQQGRDATARGKALYPGVDPGKANDYYYADRVRAMMATWSDVFKGQEKRIVRVLGTMLWDLRGDQRLGHKETYKFVDAMAIAPYWGERTYDINSTGQARIEAVLAKAPGQILDSLRQGHANKVVAAKYGLPLITYEGGPGYFAYEPAEVKDLQRLSHDPRIVPLYQDFLRRWQKEIGGPLVLFEGTGSGMFAHKDYTGQPLSDAPKMRAVVDFIRQLPAAQQPRAAKPAT